VNGQARLRVECGPDNRSIVTRLEDSPPVAIRRCQDAFYLVATAAGPIGTDRVAIDVEVGPGATLAMRSVGAMIAYTGSGASLQISAAVEEGATLMWLPEPMIVTGHCSLDVRSTIVVADAATVVWREELLLGRYEESPGRLHHRFSADVGGHPLLRHDLELGPGAQGWDGPAVLGDHRAVGFSLAIGGGGHRDRGGGEGWADMALEGPGILTVAVAHDLITLRRRLGLNRGAVVDGSCEVCLSEEEGKRPDLCN